MANAHEGVCSQRAVVAPAARLQIIYAVQMGRCRIWIITYNSSFISSPIGSALSGQSPCRSFRSRRDLRYHFVPEGMVLDTLLPKRQPSTALSVERRLFVEREQYDEYNREYRRLKEKVPVFSCRIAKIVMQKSD